MREITRQIPQIYGAEKLYQVLENRMDNKPLITVSHVPEFLLVPSFKPHLRPLDYIFWYLVLLCKSTQVSNHVAAMDDPLVVAALLPPSVILDAQNLRWTLCATDRCFRNPVTSAFFKHVKVLPVSRGDGIYQKVFSFLRCWWDEVIDILIASTSLLMKIY